jgi:hypothetical protein
LAYNHWEKKLFKILEGNEQDPEEVAKVLNYLVELGIEEWVLSMSGYFDSKFIADFVALSRALGDPEEDRRRQYKGSLRGRCQELEPAL